MTVMMHRKALNTKVIHGQATNGARFMTLVRVIALNRSRVERS